jgi:hypothetical protein
MDEIRNRSEKFFVENGVYYHIQNVTPYKPTKWAVDQVYFIGNRKNPFVGYYDSKNFVIQEETVEHYRNILSEYLKLTREWVFEEVRREFFPNLPSRHRCLWVIPDDTEAIRYWWRTMGKTGEILKLELTGKIYRTNQQYLKATTASLDQIRMNAFKYWSGASGDNPAEDEYLFEGFAKVLDVVDPSSIGL